MLCAMQKAYFTKVFSYVYTKCSGEADKMEKVQAVMVKENDSAMQEERKKKFNELWLTVIRLVEGGKEL